MSRQVKWVQKVAYGQFNASVLSGYELSGEKPVITLGMDEMGCEVRCGEPIYDNGSYYVIDTVKDLKYVVLDNNNSMITEVDLDKYEAIRLADDYKDADARSGYNGGDSTHMH